MTRPPRASDPLYQIPRKEYPAIWSGNEVTRNTGWRRVAAIALKSTQLANQQAALAGDDGARAGLHHRERHIDRCVAGRIVAHRRHQLKDGGAGQ